MNCILKESQKSSIHHISSIELLSSISTETIDMIYTDPPFGTNMTQKMDRKKDGVVLTSMSYNDQHKDYLEFLRPHLLEFHRVLKNSGTMYLHLDYRWVHYVKVECDQIFGRDNFLSEVIWAYDFGGRGKDRWPAKHDTILVYTKKQGEHIFNWEDIDRIPYMAPELQKDPERAAKGKVPTNVWWMSIVGTNSKERTGYPSQKPQKLLERAIVASSPMGGVVLDPFAGSGTTGGAALATGRLFILGDQSEIAINVMKERFVGQTDIDFVSKQNVDDLLVI